ncbi:MAG: PTS sugar transporter subunit IIC [Clostridiales bacterium]|nr:PTS sugar transporter subunit IIC [Clostridiales bacterium]
MSKNKTRIRDYVATVFDGMAKGLFASLIIGVVIKQAGVYCNSELLMKLGQIAQYMMGPAVGAGVAYARGCKQFSLLAAMAAGAIGAGCIALSPVEGGGYAAAIAVGEPVGAVVAALIGLELAKLVEGKSKFDLLLVPALVILAGGLAGVFVSPVMSQFMKWLGLQINNLTVMQPLPSGILLGLIIGMILSSPISSAGVCIAIGIDGLAAGAALAGCAAQMVGFAFASYRENGLSGLIGIGLGTSKIMLPNIVRNPKIWIPASVASALCGGLSTVVFQLQTNSVGAGMGTCALVGPFTVVATMGGSVWWQMVLLYLVIPAAVASLVSAWMRKINWVRPDDMLLK